MILIPNLSQNTVALMIPPVHSSAPWSKIGFRSVSDTDHVPVIYRRVFLVWITEIIVGIPKSDLALGSIFHNCKASGIITVPSADLTTR